MNLNEADAHSRLGLPVPLRARLSGLKRVIAKLNWFFLHHQVAFNAEVVRALREEVQQSNAVLARVDELDERLRSLSSSFDSTGADMWSAITAQSSQLDHRSAELWSAITSQADRAESQNADLWSATKDLGSTLGSALDVRAGELWEAINNQTDQLDQRAGQIWKALEEAGKQLDKVSTDLWETIHKVSADLSETIDKFSADLWEAIHKIADAVTEARDVLDQGETALKIHVDLMQRQAFERHHEGIGALQGELADMSLQMADLFGRIEKVGERLDAAATDLDEKLAAAAAETRRRQGTVDALLDRVRRSLPEPPTPDVVAALPDAVSNMYPDFEEVFRGSSEAIAQSVSAYLPDIAGLDRHGPVVDLGSGRGEWLEILKQAGIDAYGVDLNEDFVEQCRARGLKVVHGDVCEHLETLPERSLSALTAFHLAEHMPVDALVRLLDVSLRALESGGLLIIETPNPENVTVGSSSFYLDPGHVRPLPPGLLAFLLEARGFSKIETRFLHPTGTGLQLPSTTSPWAGDLAPLVDVINTRLFGPQDYAVIGRRL